MGPQVAVFIDGCFWHGCPEHYVRPRSREAFWSAKLTGNVLRDLEQTRSLGVIGWRVIRIWEHEVFTQLGEVADRIVAAVRDGSVTSPDGWRVLRVEVIDPDRDLERRHLVALNDPARELVVEQVRSTAKWRRSAVNMLAASPSGGATRDGA